MSWMGQMAVYVWFVQNVLSYLFAIIYFVWNYPMICIKNMQHFFAPEIKKTHLKKNCKQKAVAMSMHVVNRGKSVSSGPSIDNWASWERSEQASKQAKKQASKQASKQTSRER